MLLRLLLIIFIVYLIVKFSAYVLRAFYYNLTGEQPHKRTAGRTRRRPVDGNVDIDYVPEDYNKSKADQQHGSKGEYVDYEEIKN